VALVEGRIAIVLGWPSPAFWLKLAPIWITKIALEDRQLMTWSIQTYGII
jgi:hypothetical protein